MTGLCLGERLADPVSSWAVSVQITERYIGCKQPLRAAVNDKLGIEPKRVVHSASGRAADYPSKCQLANCGQPKPERFIVLALRRQ